MIETQGKLSSGFGSPSSANGAENPAPGVSTPEDFVDAKAADETLYLLGRRSVNRFLRFVRREAINSPDESTLINQWESAKKHLHFLEESEAGCADHPKFSPIDVDGKYQSLLLEFLQDPLVKHGFNTVPTEVAMVELDSLVVYQQHIDLTHVARLKQRIGAAPSDEAVFRASLSNEHRRPPAKWNHCGDGTFVFVSPSNDIRPLGHMPLDRENIVDYPPPGDLVCVIGQAIGFGSNFLNAFYVENRLILHNGSHRAYALRELGVTHVPCIVQHVSTRDELDVVAPSEVRENPDRYLKVPRPAMFKDYFDPKLRAIMPVRRLLKEITVKIRVEERFIPAF